MKNIDIGEVARRSGLPASTLRYYEERDDTIRRLTAMRNGLRHAAACPARTHMDCPTFRRLLRASASGAVERRARAGQRAPRPPTARATRRPTKARPQ